MRVIILFFINWNLLAGYLPDQEVANRLKLLDYNKSFKVISFKKYRTKRKYEIFRVKLRTENANPALKGPLITEFFWYRPKLSMVQAKARPLIVISPPIVGVDPLEKALSHNFTSREPYYNTFILIYSEKINDKNRPISKLDESFIKSIVQGRILLDFAETQPKYIDAKKIACYGISLGGIMSAMLIGVDARVDSAVVIVGGGNFPEILKNSKQFIVKGYREARMKAEKIQSLDDFESKLRKNLSFDPLYFASLRSPSDVFMVIALDDTAVPTKNQLELYEAFGRPQSVQYHVDHAPAIFKSLPQHAPILDFLSYRFSMSE